MNQETSIEEIRKKFSEDLFATENGAFIEAVGDHYAKCSIAIGPRHMNAAGAVMGGVYFVLADFTFAVAANHLKMEVVSLNSTITYLGPMHGQKMIAEAFRVKEGRTTVYYRIELKDEKGNLLAEVCTTGFRKIQ